jgi:hypothetical protein
MHDTSDEEVEGSSSDNDEDSNKASSTYSPEDGYFLSLKHLGNKDHQPCTKTSTLDRKLCQKYMGSYGKHARQKSLPNTRP